VDYINYVTIVANNKVQDVNIKIEKVLMGILFWGDGLCVLVSLFSVAYVNEYDAHSSRALLRI
jgi:hypothetical protein